MYTFSPFTGGVIVFAVNSLIYMNQSVPPFGVSLNSLTDFSTDFLLSKWTMLFHCRFKLPVLYTKVLVTFIPQNLLYTSVNVLTT